MNTGRWFVAAAAVAVACVSTLAEAANPPAHMPCAREFDVPITISNRSNLTASDLDAIVETARRLWQPYGVTIAPGHGRGVEVMVSDGATERDGSGRARKVLGTTVFRGGHAAPSIRLWVGGAEALLDDSLSPHAWNMPTTQRDALLVPMLGVALAHEIGHVLLDTSPRALRTTSARDSVSRSRASNFRAPRIDGGPTGCAVCGEKPATVNAYVARKSAHHSTRPLDCATARLRTSYRSLSGFSAPLRFLHRGRHSRLYDRRNAVPRSPGNDR